MRRVPAPRETISSSQTTISQPVFSPTPRSSRTCVTKIDQISGGSRPVWTPKRVSRRPGRRCPRLLLSHLGRRLPSRRGRRRATAGRCRAEYSVRFDRDCSRLSARSRLPSRLGKPGSSVGRAGTPADVAHVSSRRHGIGILRESGATRVTVSPAQITVEADRPILEHVLAPPRSP